MDIKYSRRKFIHSTSAGLAGVMILPSLGACTSKQTKGLGVKTITMGAIGLGRRGMTVANLLMNQEGVKMVAGCDVYGRKRTRFENEVNEFYEEKGEKIEVKTYENYQDLLAREDIDAVLIATPDHWHALNAIAACDAGKDIYLEKPMTLTIKEGQELVKAVRRNNVILAIGSQQRSDPSFKHVIKQVQEGKLGRIEKINAYVGAPPKPYDLPAQQIPEDLDWDRWLGPLPGNIPFNNELNPPISLDPPENEKFWAGWRWYKEMGGGFTTDWGAHMFDIAQWAINMDRNGPVEASPIGDGTEFMEFKYENGIVLTTEPFNEKLTKGVKFWGDNGWMEISRDYMLASRDDLMPNNEEFDFETPFELRNDHVNNFIEALRNRTEPTVPVEIGHSSCTMCTIGNIACDLGRTVKWDPIKQVFVDDEDGSASALMQYLYRKPWKL